MTNYEKITNMAIEELAEMLALNYACCCCIRQSCDSQQSGLMCYRGIVEWLNSKEQPK
jgi:hypothetical protein